MRARRRAGEPRHALYHAWAWLLLALGWASAAHAAPAEAEFSDFLAHFRAALARPDTIAVAELTRLPFLFDGEWRDRDGFQAVVPELFSTPVRECIARAMPLAEDDAQVIFCDPYIFYFRRQGTGAWRFEEFATDAEALP